MRIVICGAQIPFNYGGAEILVEELNRQLISRGHQSEIVNIPFKWYPKEQLIDNALTWRMIDLTESNGEKIDLVICTKYPTYAVKHPNKVVWLFHQHRPVYDLLNTPYSEFSQTGDDIRIIQHIRQIDRVSLSEAKKVFSISENVKSRLEMFNGINSEVLYPPTKLDGMYKEGEFGDYIFSAGRLDPLKRVELMIRALKYMKSNIKFLIAGRGKHETELKKLVASEGLENRVVFLGFLKDEELITYYSNASAIFFAPKDEDYGFITIEAFKSGKPVITTNDSGGVLEFVSHQKNGLVLESNIETIARNVDVMIENYEMLKSYGKHGKEIVASINWNDTVNKLLSIVYN